MEKRIYYHDTDAGGVVYYANYLKYLEEARTEYLEQKGWGIGTLSEHGLLYAVRECLITYKSPARYGDTIICEAKIDKITAAQLFFSQTIIEKTTQRLIVTSDIKLVCLTPDFKPTQIPDKLRDLLSI